MSALKAGRFFVLVVGAAVGLAKAVLADDAFFFGFGVDGGGVVLFEEGEEVLGGLLEVLFVDHGDGLWWLEQSMDNFPLLKSW